MAFRLLVKGLEGSDISSTQLFPTIPAADWGGGSEVRGGRGGPGGEGEGGGGGGRGARG